MRKFTLIVDKTKSLFISSVINAFANLIKSFSTEEFESAKIIIVFSQIDLIFLFKSLVFENLVSMITISGTSTLMRSQIRFSSVITSKS